jgi:hypothetical protein
MIKNVKSSKMKIDENGCAYLEDQSGNQYYCFDWNGSPSNTKAKIKMDKFTFFTCLFLFVGLSFVIYCVFIR